MSDLAWFDASFHDNLAQIYLSQGHDIFARTKKLAERHRIRAIETASDVYYTTRRKLWQARHDVKGMLETRSYTA